MLAFKQLWFTDRQVDKALSIMDRVECTYEGWADAVFGGQPKRAHYVILSVPSSHGGWYKVYVGGYDGKIQMVNCNCEAGVEGACCYHVKAALEWIKSRPATKASLEGNTLAHALAQCVDQGVLSVA
jgi:hypothetical protein